MPEEVIYRDYRPEDPIPEITAMLHLAYGSLLRMGFRYTATHQDDATTLRRLQRGHPFIAECGGRIIGTVTYYPPNPESTAVCYRTTPSFGQFGVHPDFQRGGIGSRLLAMVEARARSESAPALALDTAEGATHLRQWYGAFGYEFAEYATWKGVNYRSVILVKKLTAA